MSASALWWLSDAGSQMDKKYYAHIRGSVWEQTTKSKTGLLSKKARKRRGLV